MKDLEVMLAQEEWQRAGAYRVRIQGMIFCGKGSRYAFGSG